MSRARRTRTRHSPSAARKAFGRPEEVVLSVRDDPWVPWDGLESMLSASLLPSSVQIVTHILREDVGRPCCRPRASWRPPGVRARPTPSCRSSFRPLTLEVHQKAPLAMNSLSTTSSKSCHTGPLNMELFYVRHVLGLLLLPRGRALSLTFLSRATALAIPACSSSTSSPRGVHAVRSCAVPLPPRFLPFHPLSSTYL